jgi:serine/threonine protein kinase/Tol biopolymer transport system component
MTILSGTRLGPYEVLAPLGAGGMGEVYRAKDTRVDRPVALKVLPEEFFEDPERRARFEREARTLASLNHPGIAILFAFEEVSGRHLLAMELVEGEGLEAKIASGPLPLEDSLAYAKQIAEALEAAHERGVIHRDLKPANVKVTPEGRVKLLDFGLAKIFEGDGGTGSSPSVTHSPTLTARATAAGMILGTAAYMAPEQARGKPVDKRADIWAFGVVLFEMLSGKRLFEGETVSDVLAAVLKTEPDWGALPSTTPPAVVHLVRRCLERDPKLRLRDIGDARLELGEASRPEPDRARSEEGPQAAQAISAPPARRRGLWIVAVVVLACLAVGFLVGSRFGKHRAPDVTFKPLNFRPETIFNARFAPNGRTIFYSAARSGNEPEIFTVSPEDPEARSIGLKRTALLSVSSKGELALLTNARYDSHEFFLGTLARMAPGGGAPREVVEGVREADWSPDGSELAIVREVAGMDRLEYPPGKVLGETAGYFSDLRVSPDGQHIALFEHAMRYDDRGRVITFDLRGKKAILTDVWWALEGLAWSTGGKEILFSAGETYSTFSVHAVTLAGVVRRALSSQGGTQIRDVSKEGQWLASREDVRVDLFAMAPGEKAERNLTWLDYSEVRDISSDGRLILFDEESGAMGPNYSVCLRRTDGAPPVRLGEGRACGLSPDGKLALAFIPTSPGQLVLYPTGPGEARRLERGSVEDYTDARWFADGKRILISGSERGRAPRCYIQEIAGGVPRAVTPEGTTRGLISPDGQLAVVENGSGQKLIVPIAGGEPRVLPLLTADQSVVRWTLDGRSLLVHSSVQVPDPLERVEISTGRRETLRMLAPPDPACMLSIGPVVVADDLTTYAYSANPQRSSLFLIEGAR